jgi:hypothetical protein
MGRLPQGIQGPLQGKAGTLIGSSRNGIPYVKGLYKKRTKTISNKEMANRKKFAMAQSWLAPLVDFVREGFRNYSPQSYGFVAAKSLLLKNSFVQGASEMSIDPALVKVSFGSLPLADNLTVSKNENGDLAFSWNPDNKQGADPSDQIMMLAYDIEKGNVSYTTTGQLRSTGTDVLKLSTANLQNFHVYAAFNAFDRSRQSDSVYLGEWKI